MKRFHLLAIASFASLPLVLACAPKNQASQDPNAGTFDEYYSETPDDSGSSDGGDSTNTTGPAKARETSSTSHRAREAAMAKAKKLKSKKEPVKGDKKKPKKRKRKKKVDPDKVTIDGVVPSMASVGSVVEISGTGLKQKGLHPILGGKKQKIIERTDERMVVEIVGGKGKLGVGTAKGPKGKKTFTQLESTSFKFVTPKPKNVPFSVRKNVNHGLIGNVYAIENPVEEVPAFDSLGEPIGTVGVANLDVPSRTFNKKLFGRSEWFAIHFQGSLNVVEEGDYELCLAAGSGALLFLDGTDVIDNDGSHETKEECTELFIEPGEYKVDLLYYQGAVGEMGLTLSWAKDGGEKAPIPTEALFPPDDRLNTMLKL